MASKRNGGAVNENEAPRTDGAAALADRASGPVLEMRSITRRFGDGESAITAVDAIDLTLERGEFVAICGESGSGKSTLLQIAGCLDRPDSGTYHLNGREVAGLTDRELAEVRNRDIGFVFQAFHLLGDRSALENVGLPLEYRRAGGSAPGDPKVVLERVGLAARGSHRPAQLSGGERQRVAIARALVKRPPLLLCDEPTGNLAQKAGQEVMELLRGARDEQGRTVVLVTHNPRDAAFADRVLFLVDGELAPEAELSGPDIAVEDVHPALGRLSI